MKTFFASPIHLYDAARALGLPNHIGQVSVIVVAARKADIIPMMVKRGFSEGSASDVAKAARVNDKFRDLLVLREAGFVPEDEPGVYVTSDTGGHSPLVLRAELDGTLRAIAHFTTKKGQKVALRGKGAQS